MMEEVGVVMTGIRPAPSTSRAASIDSLRGLALTGILLVHLQEFYECKGGNLVVTSGFHNVIFTVFAGKAFSLLAICFGFSCHAVANSKSSGRLSANISYSWRLLILAVIGWAHSLLYRDDILTALAGIGLLLLPLQAVRSNRILLAVAAICFLQPFMLADLLQPAPVMRASASSLKEGWDVAGHVYATGSLLDVFRINLWVGQSEKWAFLMASGRLLQMMGYAIVGTVLGRTGFFDDNSQSPWTSGRPFLMIFFAGLAVLASRAYFHSFLLGGASTVAKRKMLATSWSDLLLTCTYLIAFKAVWSARFRSYLQWLTPLGRMSLTFYIGQSLLFVPLFYHFGLGWCETIGARRVALIGIVACIIQVQLAIIWRRHFVYGPVEWLWRAGTKLTFDIPFRKTNIPVLGAPFAPHPAKHR